MSATDRAPKTIEQLRSALRLEDQSKAEALIQAEPVKEAYRKYANRCLSSSSTTKLLPDWKEVDEYLIELRMRLGGKTLEEVVEQKCNEQRYELKPHVALFALRIMTFFKSEEGEVYDNPLELHRVRIKEDVSFDRCVRIMNLLGFLVNQNRERQAERAAAAAAAAPAAAAAEAEQNWI
ncbi:uncharacterized protein F4807DRAFT_239132 [Annulohypoxylon truncatum]|uniref:uncharacterized protein n=1 Tax=Annulohypoxylon truncatum TaxID=327061 RepID=UPI0020077F11|nr:uncharacterized protein F4807DRAFT_239132 [Annulohypoxylon truncatum]KAI1206146.1 hypothetical protein F4807DRAFT_239132 [Annulohypoxylon truncatum]